MNSAVIFIFRNCPPEWALELRKWGYRIASLRRCRNVEHVRDLETFIKENFVVVVGDKRLAESLGITHVSLEELSKFLLWLQRELPPLYKPLLQ